MEKIVLIPAYKPEEDLTDLVSRLCAKGLSVVVVDDGSGEDYIGIFKSVEKHATVVHCEQNGGKGTAIKRGLSFLRDNIVPPYVVITADADGQHRIEDICRVAEKSEQNPGSLVLGYRSFKNMPAKNWWGNIYTRVAFLFSTGKYIQDTQTGLRGFSHNTIPFLLGVDGARYEYEMNVLLYWTHADLPIEQLQIETVYFDGNSRSHFQALWDSLRIYGKILRFSFPAFGCFLLDIALFAALFFLLPLPASLFIANAAARLVTSALQFGFMRGSARKHFSFLKISTVRYFALVTVMLGLNMLLLWAFSIWGLPVVAAKIFANVIQFFAGFSLLPKVFYRKDKTKR